MSFANSQTDDQNQALKEEINHLQAQVAALEQLLEVYEQETIEKSTKLENTLVELNEHTQRLSHAESTLATLRSMLNSMGDAVVVVDRQGKFLFLNSPAQDLLGILPSHHSLQTWAQSWQVFLPDQRQPYPLSKFPLVQAMQGATPQASELFVQLPQAQGNWFSVTARELTSADGELQGGVAVFHNITSLKQVEIALRQSEMRSREQATQLQDALDDLQKMQFQLVQTEKMSSLGQLVAGIAHEINNPVNFIYGNVTHARQNVEDLLRLIALYQQYYPDAHPAILAEIEEMDLEFVMGDLPKLLSSMKVGAERIQGIVSSLRTFSRMDEADMKSVDIHSGIESTLLILQNRLKDQSDAAEIQVLREYGELPTVECYAGQLNQVFMNILSNAIDALEEVRLGKVAEKETAVIKIQTALEQQDQVSIRISDNGSGIAEKVQHQLFNPFFTTKPIGQGTGLGLSLSYQIVVEKHRGQLRCESHVGWGTTFVIQIPLSQTATVQ